MPRARPTTNPPRERVLRVYAFDPSRGARLDNHLAIRVPYEPLAKGPVGGKVAVIDYDAGNRCYYEGVDPGRAVDPRRAGPRAVGGRTRSSTSRWSTRWRWTRSGASRRRSAARSGGGRTIADRRGPAGREIRIAGGWRLPPRAAGGQRLLRPEAPRAAVRLLHGLARGRRRQPARAGRLHLPVARHRGARDHARGARRHPRALQRADRPRRARLPRGLRRHRRAAPALQLSGHAARDDPAHRRADPPTAARARGGARRATRR